jgi:hypothetical protein
LAATSTTTTTSINNSVRSGTQLVVDSISSTQTVGSFATDISLQPYINSRIISFLAFNMRPNERMHIFFDSINVDEYCAPAVIDANNKYVLPASLDSSDSTQIAKNGDWGTPIFSDSLGVVAGQFYIPAGKFKTGDRLVQITDVDSLVLGGSAFTTMSSAYFTASNLNVTKQAITLTTVNPELRSIPIEESVVTTSTNVVIRELPDIINVRANAWEPIAQALTINTPQNESGIFATSLELYFKQKAQTSEHGVTVYLCEIDNGYPNGNAVLPFSRVHLPYSNINISNTSTVSTKFTFEAPVFLANKTTYAFVVKPDANDPDYFVWSANLGDIDVSTGFQVSSQPAIGTAFYGATETQWTALQTEYIKFKLNRASFQYNSANAVFNNSNTEYLTVFNLGYSNTSVGIVPGDIVFNSTNSLSNSSGGTVNTSIRATVNYYDSVRGILYCESSTGNFVSNTFVQVHRFANNSLSSSPNNVTLIAYANTSSLYNPGVNALVPQFATISPPGTTLNFTYTGTNNTYSIDSEEYKVNPGYETEFYDYERIVVSKSNEMASMSGNKSVTIKGNMTTDTEYLSPVIDTARQQELVIKNDIDPVEIKYNEFFNSGNTKSKYVSQIVTLADGQDAEDLQVLLTAFKPVGSSIQVWAKFLNKEDPRPMSQQTWTPLLNDSIDVYSDPSNPNDFRELKYSLGSYYSKIIRTGTITCSNTSNTIAGNGTLFTTELEPGWYINTKTSKDILLQERTRKIVSITNSTSVVLDSPFFGNYTNEPYYLVAPPTTAWLSTEASVQLTGNVSTYTTNNSIVGNGTLFATELLPGNIINVAGDSQTILSITNSTFLTVGTPWSSNNSGANAYVISAPGVTYLNENLNLYSSFNRFQLKIILQSNDTSKVPIMDDLRVLALQM